MDQEMAQYIISYFSYLLSDKEKLAIRHFTSMSKLEGSISPNSVLESVYKRKGWITEDPTVLDLLKDGYDSFERKVAWQILQEFPDKVVLNNCPKCGQLARTPQARQCRCGFDWH